MTKPLKIVERGVVFQKTTLPNGIRVLTELIPTVRSVSLGVWVDVGSRCELPRETGLSHFIEHLVFKGTKRRNAKQIGASLETLGGMLNAFTTREHTCFTARVLDEFLVDAVDVLADITCHATLTPKNMNRERMVISEEIKESLDTPSDHIHDLFFKTFWGDHPLGQPILGTAKNIAEVPRKVLRGYMQKHYRPESVVIAASGAVSHSRLVRLVKEHFTFEDGPGEPITPPDRTGAQALTVKEFNSSQTHYCLGFPGVSFGDDRKMAMLLLTSYLGGGMSSTLFQKVRELRGLAYTVYSYHDFFRDGGVFGVYLGTDHTRVQEAHDVVLAEIARVRKRRLTDAALDKVKAQLKGNLLLGLESTSHRMHRLGRQELMTSQYVTVGNTIRRLERVTPKDVQAMANEQLRDELGSVALLGPVEAKSFDPGPVGTEV